MAIAAGEWDEHDTAAWLRDNLTPPGGTETTRTWIIT